MLQKIFTILNEERLLYRAALENELARRRAILAADGRRLQELSRKSEVFVKEASALERKRNALAAALPTPGEGPLTLRGLLELGAAEAEVDRSLLAKVREQFEKTVRELKIEVDENRRLLEHSSRNLTRALRGLQNEVDPTDETYRPDGTRGSGRQARNKAAVLLNANA